MRINLLYLAGSFVGNSQEIDLLPGENFQFGRLPSNDIVFDPQKDIKASGVHARLFCREEGICLLEDLNSSNGTFIGGERLARVVQVCDGDVVTFGGGGPQIEFKIKGLSLQINAISTESTNPPKSEKNSETLEGKAVTFSDLYLSGEFPNDEVLSNLESSKGTAEMDGALKILEALILTGDDQDLGSSETLDDVQKLFEKELPREANQSSKGPDKEDSSLYEHPSIEEEVFEEAFDDALFKEAIDLDDLGISGEMELSSDLFPEASSPLKDAGEKRGQHSVAHIHDQRSVDQSDPLSSVAKATPLGKDNPLSYSPVSDTRCSKPTLPHAGKSQSLTFGSFEVERLLVRMEELEERISKRQSLLIFLNILLIILAAVGIFIGL